MHAQAGGEEPIQAVAAASYEELPPPQELRPADGRWSWAAVHISGRGLDPVTDHDQHRPPPGR